MSKPPPPLAVPPPLPAVKKRSRALPESPWLWHE
jgi:hypothetical protein